MTIGVSRLTSPSAIVVTTRPQIAVGTSCMWWGAISAAAVAQTPSGDVLRCPTCGGHVETTYTEETFMWLARRFELLGFPQHQALIRWLKGRCYQTRGEAWAAFATAGLPTL